MLVALVGVMGNAQEIDFINSEANHIALNGADWSALRQSLSNPKKWTDGKWQAIHIGDSHVQPDLFTAPIRARLQDKYGNGGRGLLPALNLARTNEPADYILKSSRPVAQSSRLLSRTWSTDMGLTGVAVRFDSTRTTLRITAKNHSDRFSRVTMLHAEGEGYETAMIADSVYFARQRSPWAQEINLSRSTDTLSITVPCQSDFYGVVIANDKRGVMLHAIGNNGATYYTYNRVNRFGEQLQTLAPQLIIISLGTNEAFGNISGVESSIHSLVSSIRRANPKATLLLTTPMECQKRVSTKVATKVPVGRKRKKRFKTVYKTVSSYAINDNVDRVRQIILDYGRRHKIATWDLYAVAGGRGAASKWVAAGLMNPGDHLHQLESGYDLQGTLLADALMEQLGKKK